MAYTKTTWSDRQVQKPLTFTQITNGDGTITLAPAEGTVTQAGTPITSTALNNLETQYDNAIADINATKGLLFGDNFSGFSMNGGYVAGVPLVSSIKEMTSSVFSANNTTDSSKITFLKGGVYQIHIEYSRSDLLVHQSWYIGFSINDLGGTITKTHKIMGEYGINWSSGPNNAKVPLSMTQIRRISAGDYIRFMQGSDDGPRSYTEIKFHIMRIAE